MHSYTTNPKHTAATSAQLHNPSPQLPRTTPPETTDQGHLSRRVEQHL